MRPNDPVRTFLMSAAEARIEIDRCEARLARAEEECNRLTAQLSGMPRSGQVDKHNDAVWIAYAELKEKLKEKYRNYIALEDEAEDFIQKIKEPVHRELLRFRYLDGKRWPEVMLQLERLGYYYTERQMFNIHGEALQSARKIWEEMQGAE